MSRWMIGGCLATVCAAGLRIAAQSPAALAQYKFEPDDPACLTRTLASAGGIFPRNPHTLVLRWVGYANYEIEYNNQVLLFDTYVDRGAGFQPLGVKASDIKKVDGIFIGHGHFDHMSDAASIASRTGATVVGGPPTAEQLRKMNLDSKQIRSVTGKGGETMKFKGFTVEPVLGRHSENPTTVLQALGKTMQEISVAKPLTPAEKAERAEILKRGTGDG